MKFKTAKIIPVLALTALAIAGSGAQALTLERIKDTGIIRIGYQTDARPLSYQDAQGAPSGFSVALCAAVAAELGKQAGVADLAVEYVAMQGQPTGDLFPGQIDLHCGAAEITLKARSEVSFSTPIYQGGLVALVRDDAPYALVDLLQGAKPTDRPAWRATIGTLLSRAKVAAIADGWSDVWVEDRKREIGVIGETVLVPNDAAGIAALINGEASVLIGHRAPMMQASVENESLRLLDKAYSNRPIGLAFARGDEDFAQAIDRALTGLYDSGDAEVIYSREIGELSEQVGAFFEANKVPPE